MANQKPHRLHSAAKHMRADAKKRLMNRSRKSQIHTAENALNSAISAGILKSYTVTIKEGGYTVLFAINRSALTENMISMYASVALGDSTGRAYVAVDSAANAAGNAAKPYANVYKVVDAQ